jgi:hypothetical protein
MVQVPTATNVTALVSEIVQIDGVVDEKLTASPELAVAFSVNDPAENGNAVVVGLNVIV